MTDDDPFRTALDALYGAPFAAFVAERKRLAAELKAGGLKLPAQRLAAVTRPPVSAWAVNRLWRVARTEVDALLAAAAQVRRGEPGASILYREVLGELRRIAADELIADGSAASEPTLRRIQQTLQALAAAGGFAPDAPGQLTSDRDPPGFEALAGAALASRPASRDADTVIDEAPAPVVAPDPETVVDDAADDDAADDDAAVDAAPAISAEDRAALDAAAREARRHELVTAATTAEKVLATATQELRAAETLLAAARDRLARAQATHAAAGARVAAARAALADDQRDS